MLAICTAAGDTMNPYLKTAIWIVVGIFIITHPAIVTQIFSSLSTFVATMKQGGY